MATRTNKEKGKERLDIKIEPLKSRSKSPGKLELPEESSSWHQPPRTLQITQNQSIQKSKSLTEKGPLPNLTQGKDLKNSRSLTENPSAQKLDNTIIHIRLHAEKKDFANWIKCVLAQTKTREALVIVVQRKFEILIETFEELELIEFLRCLENQNVLSIKVVDKEKRNTHFKKGRNTKAQNKPIWQCEHYKCGSIFKTLLEKYKPNQANEWEINKLFAAADNEAKKDNKTFSSKGRFWLIAKLYKYTDSRIEENKTLCDLDISQLIKLQRSCILFDFEDSVKLYDEIIKRRNQLMHSTDNLISDVVLEEIFQLFYKLLEHFGKEFGDCIKVLEDLRKFEKSKFETKVNDWVEVFHEGAKEALQTKQIAIKNDISNPSEAGLTDEKVASLKRLYEDAEDKKKKLEREMEELKVEIKKLKEISLTQNKSENSEKTNFEYFSLTKEKELENEVLHKSEKIRDSKKKINELETNMKTKEKELESYQQEKNVLEAHVKSKDEEITKS